MVEYDSLHLDHTLELSPPRKRNAPSHLDHTLLPQSSLPANRSGHDRIQPYHQGDLRHEIYSFQSPLSKPQTSVLRASRGRVYLPSPGCTPRMQETSMNPDFQGLNQSVHSEIRPVSSSTGASARFNNPMLWRANDTAAGRYMAGPKEYDALPKEALPKHEQNPRIFSIKHKRNVLRHLAEMLATDFADSQISSSTSSSISSENMYSSPKASWLSNPYSMVDERPVPSRGSAIQTSFHSDTAFSGWSYQQDLSSKYTIFDSHTDRMTTTISEPARHEAALNRKDKTSSPKIFLAMFASDDSGSQNENLIATTPATAEGILIKDSTISSPLDAVAQLWGSASHTDPSSRSNQHPGFLFVERCKADSALVIQRVWRGHGRRIRVGQSLMARGRIAAAIAAFWLARKLRGLRSAGVTIAAAVKRRRTQDWMLRAVHESSTTPAGAAML